MILLISFSSAGQRIVKGKVVSSEGKLPLQGVFVSAEKEVVATTDSNGVFEFSTQLSKPVISFSHIGYQGQSGMYDAARSSVIILYRSNAFLAEAVVKAFEKYGT